MALITPTQFFMYRWRYWLGYSALSLLLVGALLTAGLFAPGGLTQAELDSLAQTNSMTLSQPATWALPDMPLHILRLLSFATLGVTTLSIKLPSILMALIASLALFFLLRRWFRPNVAVLSLLIMVTTSQFMFIAQNAGGGINYITYTALLLLFASLILQRARLAWLWQAGLGITMALSLYTPYFLYINLGLLLVACLHPHTRSYLRRLRKSSSGLVAAGLFGVLILPLIYWCLTRPEFFLQLAGRGSGPIDLLTNLKIILWSYFWPHPLVQNGQIIPLMDASALALTALGLISTIRQHHTARAYMIFAWLVLAAPLLALQPSLIVMVTVPLFILLAVGVETLVREWYRLFPKNPYARATGLLLLICLIGVMTLSGIDRYLHGYRSMPAAVREHSLDVMLFRQLYAAEQPAVVVTTPHEAPLYQALARHQYPQLRVSDQPDPTAQHIVFTRAAQHLLPPQEWSLSRIITNQRAEAADRFYLYKKPAE